ncbi:MAG: hypothetical protein RMK81_06000, partial [Geminicoccaceae bacterium]|nr:hypothetical protein [Geminicoccaceae bacterium]
IGVRVRHWVTFHGLALNVCPDLEHFSGIVPCGLAAYPVTSLAALGIEASMERIDELLAATFGQVFDDPPIAAYDPAPTRLRSTRFAPS